MVLLRDVMSRHFECIAPERPVCEAIEKMNRLNLIALPVCGKDDRVVGILTEPEFSRQMALVDQDPATMQVSDIMCCEVETGLEHERVADVVPRMRRNEIAVLPVLDADDRLLGVFCLGGPWRRRSRP